MRLPCLFQLRVLKEAFTAIFKGPYTTRFPFVAHKPAEKFRGRPVPNEEECIGCGACAKVCPSSAIEITDEPETARRKITWHYDKCIFCGQCELNCTTEKGVHLGDEYDLALFDRKKAVDGLELELVICPACGDVIGGKKHILLLVRKLGTLAYGNLPLILTSQLKPSPGRPRLFSLLCPRCRREALLFDEYGKEVEKKP